MRARVLPLLLGIFFLSPSLWGAEQRVQMLFETEIVPGLGVKLALVGNPAWRRKGEADIQKAGIHARAVFLRLNPIDPQSEFNRLLRNNEKGTFDVSSDLARILRTVQGVATELKEPLAKEIRVDTEKNRVKLKSGELVINIDPFLKGYLADVLLGDLKTAGWQHVFVEMNGVFLAHGEDFNGPWKVPVFDNTTAYAQRTFFYQARDTAAATINWMNEGSKLPASDLKSVTVFAENACKAQGLAAATYSLGLQGAQKFLKIAGVPRAVLIDTRGEFIQFPAK